MTTPRGIPRAQTALPRRAAVRALAVILAGAVPAAAAPRPSTGAPHAEAAATQAAGMTLELRAGRVVVIGVANGSPAERAGILPLDVVLAVNDQGLVDFDRITLHRVTALIPPKPGQSTRLVLGRGPGTLSVILDQDGTDDSPHVVPEPPGILKIGDQAPGFIGRDLNGKELDVRNFLGKPILIDFWASTCPPCERAAIPLRRIAEQYEGRLQVIGVSLDVDRKAFEAFVYNRHLPGRQIFDGAGWKGPIARLYHVPANGIPYSVLLDARGLIVGWGDLDDLEESIERLASKRP